MSQHQKAADEYAEQILADKLQHQLYCNAAETVLLHDALTDAVLWGVMLAKEAEYEKGYLQGLKDAKLLPGEAAQAAQKQSDK